MDDPLLVSRFERTDDLTRDDERFSERHRTASDSRRQRFALDELEYEELRAARFLESVDGGDAGVIQSGEELRLALKSCDAVGLVSERVRKQLQRDIATELRVARTIHLTHAASADGGDDLVRAEPLTWRKS